MKKKLFTLLIMTAIVLSLTACGQAPASTPAETAANDAPQAEDGQNPVMNVIGIYHADESESIEALVEAEGAENAKITVTYAGSPWFRNVTVMSGRFDTETFTVEFENATLTEYTYNSDGSVGTETVSYTDGKGRAVFHPENNRLTITEEYESGPIVTAYSWGPASNMMTVTDPQHYAGVTAMDKYQVEGVVGFQVRTWYLSENWYAMADMIRYPITINGTELADSVAFIEYMQDKTISDSDRQAMMDENFLDMFVNGQGICMGSGQVWLNDPNYMTDNEPRLEIIAISGIVSETPDEGTEIARQDGERFEAVIILEGMEETVRYEHIVNTALGFEMDYDYENFVRQSDAERERFISDWDDPANPENYLELTHSTEDAETTAAAIIAELSQDYDITQETRELDNVGPCIWFEASVIKGTNNMADQLQWVYIIPAPDGCIVARAHSFVVESEGFGHRFAYMLNTLAVLA